MRIAIVPALLCLAATPMQVEGAARADWTARVEQAVAREVKDGFAGAVLVARGDRIVMDAEYAQPPIAKPTTARRYIISSTAKQFVSAALLKCQERQLLSLDDPVGRFIPQARAPLSTVTIRQLLTHTSGLAQGYASEDASSRDEVIRLILSEPLTVSPGERFQYSNENYRLAAAILEIVAGVEYATFAERELFAPAGMRDTGRITRDNAATLAPLPAGLPPRLTRATWGMQGYYSTTRDLFAWYRALRGGKVLDAASVAQLFAPSVKIQEGRAALGWFVGQTDAGVTRIFTRGNDDFGPNSLVYIYPDDDTVVIVLTHAGDNDQGRSWSRSMLKAIESALFAVAP
jgi:CubicO group peptidase (beta-lactamase class C family)